jgi:hypothetical protein
LDRRALEKAAAAAAVTVAGLVPATFTDEMLSGGDLGTQALFLLYLTDAL